MLRVTPLQYEILALISRGYSISAVSRQLNISVATAKTHAIALYQRLHVHGKHETVHQVLRRKVIPPSVAGAKLSVLDSSGQLRPLTVVRPIGRQLPGRPSSSEFTPTALPKDFDTAKHVQLVEQSREEGSTLKATDDQTLARLLARLTA